MITAVNKMRKFKSAHGDMRIGLILESDGALEHHIISEENWERGGDMVLHFGWNEHLSEQETEDRQTLQAIGIFSN